MLLALGLLLARRGSAEPRHPPFRHPVVAPAQAEATQPGAAQPEGIVDAGDTVELMAPTLPVAGNLLVKLPNAKRGFVPMTALALALPDSLRRQR